MVDLTKEKKMSAKGMVEVKIHMKIMNIEQTVVLTKKKRWVKNKW